MRKIGDLLILTIIIFLLATYVYAEKSGEVVNKKFITNIDKSTIILNNDLKSNKKIDSAVYSVHEQDINLIIETEDDGDNIKTLSVDGKIRKFNRGKFQTIKISKNKIQELEQLPNVKKVWADRINKVLLDVSIPLIGADKLWNGNLNGSGIKVCVLDTGLNKTHPALSSRIINESDFTGSNTGANDIYAHGSHVAGIVASTNETYRGVAFGASILNSKVLNDSGEGLDSWVMNGIDWCISQGADILTMSLGSTDSPNDGTDALSQYTDLAVEQGKILTIAAGNSGPNSGTIACPGCAHKVITVGAVYKKDYGSLSWSGCTDSSTAADQLTCFSSRGPTDDQRIKPDVLAPGAQITSVKNTYGFVDLSGTSMSAPMVAGLSALLLQAKPSLSPEEMKALLMDSAYDYGVFGKDNNYGAGRINATRAFNEINFTSRGVITNIDKAHNIYVPNGTKEIRATLYWAENSSVHNDVDLYLYDPSGFTKSSFSSTSILNTDEMVKVSNPKVFGWWKIIVSPYTVNNSQKYAIASNLLTSEQFYFRTNSTSSIIFHQINVTNSSQVKINIDWNTTAQDLDIHLYNTSGNLKSLSVSANTTHENITAENPETGMWLLRIVPASLGQYKSVRYAITSSFSVGQKINDTTKPKVEIKSPVNTTYAGSINLSFNTSDNFNSYIDCYYYLNGTKTYIASVNNNTQYSTLLSLQDGVYSLYLNCSDLSNNFEASSTAEFSIDNTAPNFTINSPINNSYYNVNLVQLNVSIIELAKWLNGSLDSQISDFCSNCSAYNQTLSLTDGLHTLTVLAFDFFDNINNKTISFTVDTSSPIINLVSTLNNSIQEIGALISFNISDITQLIVWYNNGSTNSTLTSPYNINTSNLSKSEYSITIYANDSVGNLNSQFYKFIFDNRPKINTTPVNSTLEKDVYSYDVNATDADNDILNFSLLTNPNGMIINSTTGIINWISSNLDVGNNSVAIKVDDGNLSSNQTFVLEVINVNDAPNLTSPLPLIRFLEDNYNDTLNLSLYFVDVDNKTLVFSAQSNDSNVNVTIYQNNTVRFNSTLNWNGIANVTITASDGQYSVNGSLVVNVTPVNDAPILNFIPNVVVNESDLVDINATGNVSAKDIDGDNVVFTYTWPLNSSGKWQTTYADARNYTTTVTANDGNGGITSQNVIISVLDKTNGANDTIIGNLSDITTTIQNLNLKINNSPFNSSAVIIGLNKVNFSDGSNTVLEFEFNFANTSKFNFVNLKINNTFIDGIQGILIRGITPSQGITKTVYMNRTNTTYNSVCIKDAEVSSIAELTSDCSASDEVKLACDGVSTNGYICTLEGTFYKITGLSHSGIKQITYDRASNSGSGGGSGGGGDSGGSSGGGGGGGTIGFVCNMDWKCSEWSECNNGIQTRKCDFVKVPQHIQDIECPEQTKSPEISRACEVKAETAVPKPEKSTQAQENASRIITSKSKLAEEAKSKNAGLSAITGGVVNVAKTIGGKITILTIIVLLIGTSIYIFYRRKFKNN